MFCLVHRGGGGATSSSTAAAASARLVSSIRASSSGRCVRPRGIVCRASAAGVEEPRTAEGLAATLSRGTERRYIMVGGKGGVGKTSLSAALGVALAMRGHKTLVVSTDPAHSLSDSLGQSVSGGRPVRVDGLASGQLYGLEVDPEDARAELKEFSGSDSAREIGAGVKDFMGTVGLGGIMDQVADLRLGELLDSPPPGFDEAVAISKVVKFTEDEDDYGDFTRIVFDTAPTGHTLRLLSLPEFLDRSVGKVVALRRKLNSASGAIKSLLGIKEEDDKTSERLEKFKARMQKVHDIFTDTETTEFVIVTIPTLMAIVESSRLLQSLRTDGVPVRHMVVNQVVPEQWENVSAELADKDVSAAAMRALKFCETKRKDQKRALKMIDDDPGLQTLECIQSPLFDIEITGVPALQFLGDTVFGRDA